MTHPIVNSLREIVSDRDVITDPDILNTYRRDAAALCESHLPIAAVLPTTEEQVRAIVDCARAHRVPIVPQGALTGLAGAANAIDGSIVLNTRRMNKVVEVDPRNRVAVVEPGVTNRELRLAAAEHGLTYRPDPSSWESSTIGGNIATNAGGLCCVKYGVTNRFVRGLRVVLPDGRAAALGRRTVKGVAGLNLTDLFVGSEGTLGIITQATLELDVVSSTPMTMAATFVDAAAAGRAVSDVRGAGITPSLFELIDRTVLRAINDHAHMGLDESAGALLIAQSDNGRTATADLQAIAEICERNGAFDVVVAEDSAESEQIVAARRLAYPALEKLGATLVDDVCVPISELAAMIEAVGQIAESRGLTIGVVGHAGDGNLHPTVIVDPNDDDSLAAAHAAFDEIAMAALAMGGTITGEHGVGMLKASLLEAELDPVAADLHIRIKDLLDPEHLMNPGKMFRAMQLALPTR